MVAPRWLTNTWLTSFFHNSCRTWFINIIEEEGKGKPSAFYRQLFLLVEMSILVFLCPSIVTVIDDEYNFAVDYIKFHSLYAAYLISLCKIYSDITHIWL